MSEKKNETKKSDTKRDSVSLEKGKASNQGATKKSETPTNIGKPDSGAGKGDKLRRGISAQEWSDRWDKIYGVGKYKKELKQNSKEKSDEKHDEKINKKTHI